MAIDPYAPCPGGLNKKVKFCCPDLVSELDQVQRMVEAGQRQACLDYIQKLEAKFPGRACLETTKALLQAELGRTEEAQQTIEHVLQTQPDNPVALAESATLAAATSGREAVTLLQRALAASGPNLSPKVIEACLDVANSLAAEGHVVAARAHLQGLMRTVGERAEMRDAAEMLMAIVGSPSIPPLLKTEFELVPAPPDVSWRNEFENALKLAGEGRWAEAATRFGALSGRVVAAPELWRNLAIVRAWTADDKGAAAAFHRLATLAIPLDDAVEAEATALLLDPDAAEDAINRLLLTYTTTDFERVATALPTNPQAISQPVHAAPDPDQPPPRAVFSLLDRPVPAAGTSASLDDLPCVIAQALLFGRETDREPRLEVLVLETNRDAVESILKQIAGDGLSSPPESEIFDQVPVVEDLLSVQWRPPDGTSPEDLRRLRREFRRRAVLERWPQTPMKLLGDRTPAAAAGDSAQRIRVLAKILHLEMLLGESEAHDLTNELRSKLGLPQAGPIDPAAIDVAKLPPIRFVRVITDKLTDDALVGMFQQSTLMALRPATRNFGEELLRRPAIQPADRAAVCGVLATVEPDPQRAVELLQDARQNAQKAGRSCARWDLEAFALHVQLGHSEQAKELLEHVQSRHAREPGVRESLLQLLYQMGAIGPDGRAAQPAAAAEPGIVVPGATAEPGGIWTPGGETAGGKKSSLWVPGME